MILPLNEILGYFTQKLWDRRQSAWSMQIAESVIHYLEPRSPLEELPKEEGEYLIEDDNGDFYVAKYRNGGFMARSNIHDTHYLYEIAEIVAWWPLPRREEE